MNHESIKFVIKILIFRELKYSFKVTVGKYEKVTFEPTSSYLDSTMFLMPFLGFSIKQKKQCVGESIDCMYSDFGEVNEVFKACKF